MALKIESVDFSNIDETTEVSVRQLMEQIESKNPPIILDIRQPEELHNDPAIASSIHIPMGQLMARMSELAKDKTIVIICHSGNRSLVAQRFLSTKGYDCKSLAGGMVAWGKAANSL